MMERQRLGSLNYPFSYQVSLGSPHQSDSSLQPSSTCQVILIYFIIGGEVYNERPRARLLDIQGVETFALGHRGLPNNAGVMRMVGVNQGKTLHLKHNRLLVIMMQRHILPSYGGRESERMRNRER